jgi:hypothetical protein
LTTRHGRWLGALIVSGLLLGQAPASWLAHRLNDLCANQCRLANVSGPWWAGQGELYVKAPSQGDWRLVDDIDWRLTLPLALEIHLGAGSARLAPKLAQVELTLDQIVLPADLILAQKTLALPAASWGGNLRFDQAQAVWSYAAGRRTSGLVVWEKMASSMLENIPLGSIELHWNWPDGQPLNAKVASRPDDLMSLHGDLQVSPGLNSVRFTGLVDLAPSARPRLEKYLRLIAQPVAGHDGRFAIQLHSGAAKVTQ